jgi:hypothetical protein
VESKSIVNAPARGEKKERLVFEALLLLSEF